VKDYDISFVSTGDVLRKEIAAKTEVGKKAEQVVASGGKPTFSRLPNHMYTDKTGLVSDELMLEVVKAELDRLRGKVSWAMALVLFRILGMLSAATDSTELDH
jgi:adenylate kinase family enzyme